MKRKGLVLLVSICLILAVVACAAPAPAPKTTPTPTPAPVINSIEKAQARVWVEAYNCYSAYPELTSFTAYPYSAGMWVVEGKTETIHYGLWSVDGITGKVTALDVVAAEAAPKCNIALATRPSLPPAVTAGQAEVRVWITLYDCPYDLKPKRTSFTAYQDNPQRWLVEGKEGTVLYGLWSVDTATAAITPWDGEARLKANAVCYRNP